MAVKHVARAVLRFEPTTEVIVPESRQINMWCRSHCVHSPLLRDIDEHQAQALVTSCQTARVVEVMTGLESNGKYYSVNFRNLTDHSRCSTIEFWRAPSSLEPREINAWAELIMALVQSALVVDESSLRLYERDIEGLRSHCTRSLDDESSASALVYVDDLFEGRHGSHQPQPIAGL